jgi:6-phosphofructokinase 1
LQIIAQIGGKQIKAMETQGVKRIGVFTAGGDAPGMNACIRAVVRAARYFDIEVMGIQDGYQGMIDNEIRRLDSSDVANIIQRGGTILGSSRSEEFRTEEGRAKAFKNLQAAGIEALVAIGGDGTFRGAFAFHSEHGIPTIGIPGTIDNDMYGTDNTIGYDTALNTVVDAIDKIRDTAGSHHRLFFVEVMGRDAGFIALRAGIASGAEAIMVPETTTYIDRLINKLHYGRRKKQFGIVVVAEGDDAGGATEVAAEVSKHFPEFDIRVSILGHMQRGGNPSCRDRVLASRLGMAAVEAIREGKFNVMVGEINNEIEFTDFGQAVKHHQSIREDLLRMAEILGS